MSTKSQHAKKYQKLPHFLREIREGAGLTIRELGIKLHQPHSYVYKSEAGIRRVDVTEFDEWARACGWDPIEAFSSLVKKP